MSQCEAKAFVAIWELSPSAKIAAAATQTTIQRVRQTARYLRSLGVMVKRHK